jgi:hypothetical protein
MRWEGHLARIGRRGMRVGCWLESKESDQYEDLDIRGRIILKWILEK